MSRSVWQNDTEARPKNRNLGGAKVHAAGTELASSSHTRECDVGSRLQDMMNAQVLAMALFDLNAWDTSHSSTIMLGCNRMLNFLFDIKMCGV